MVKFSDSVWIEARLRYERGEEPVTEIAAAVGVSPGRLWTRARREGWLRPSEAALLPPDEEKLLGRLFRAFERQVAELEQRFVAPESSVDERDARMLAVLAKTFETLGKLRDGREGGDEETREEDADVDLDELCTRLARHLDGLPRYQGVAGRGAGEGDRPGDEPE